MDEEEITKFTLRLPRSLYDRLGARAQRNRRSINNEITIILERYEESEEKMVINKKEEETRETGIA